jgi:hypothetical protein
MAALILERLDDTSPGSLWFQPRETLPGYRGNVRRRSKAQRQPGGAGTKVGAIVVGLVVDPQDPLNRGNRLDFEGRQTSSFSC